jgi:hypothetical protein
MNDHDKVGHSLSDPRAGTAPGVRTWTFARLAVREKTESSPVQPWSEGLYQGRPEFAPNFGVAQRGVNLTRYSFAVRGVAPYA